VRVAICGAGMGGLRAWERLAPNPVLEIVTFVDRDPRRRESSFLGVPVVPMAGFDPGDVDAIVMASMHAEAIARQLLSHGAQPARIYTLPLFEWLLRVRAANPATAMTGSGPLKECESWVV
jgi:FlaA1/EpsC-like NDP-sugar epimerase